MKQYKINNFWSGITNEIRSTLSSAFWYGENIEIKGKALKQVANNQAENAGNYSVDNYITKLIQIGTDVYGLGQDNNTNKDTSIWKKTNARLNLKNLLGINIPMTKSNRPLPIKKQILNPRYFKVMDSSIKHH